jgi:hypothetical protein
MSGKKKGKGGPKPPKPSPPTGGKPSWPRGGGADYTIKPLG